MTIEEKQAQSKKIIAEAIAQYGRIFATCSFGKDSRVLVDLMLQVDPTMTFIGIDTGHEFPEILAFADELIAETGMRFSWVRPRAEDVSLIDAQYGERMIRHGKYKCCAMKAPAIASTLMSYDAWITGLRRDETEHRRDLPIIEKGQPTKIHPLAFWTVDDIWQYIREKKLSYCPLYDEGYLSLGCKPCTKKGGKTERDGRFTGGGSDKECGLHLHYSCIE